MTIDEKRFQQLIEEGATAEFVGWDFSWLAERSHDPDPFWDYRQLVIQAMAGKTAMLDMDTGGGEFLASLAPFDCIVSATEGYAPNIPIARERLEPYGVTVSEIGDDDQLPFEDASFDLIINRHGSYDVNEIKRVLKPDGAFLTQQVGGANDREFLRDFTGVMPDDNWDLEDEVAKFKKAGFRITQKAEHYLEQTFFDVGAVVYYLRAISWLVPDFDITTYRPQLMAIQGKIDEHGSYSATKHRFMLMAIAPSADS